MAALPPHLEASMFAPTLTRAAPADRLRALGVDEADAERLADGVDVYKVEALVLVRRCPLDLALRIASF